MVLKVKQSFSAAHRLTKHSGLCRNFHGHTWQFVCSFSGTPCLGTGMITDFSKVKAMIETQVRRHLDHASILSKQDPLVHFIHNMSLKMIQIDGEPTCENLVQWIWKKIEDGLVQSGAGKTLKLESIQLWESNSSSVLFEGPDEKPKSK